MTSPKSRQSADKTVLLGTIVATLSVVSVLALLEIGLRFFPVSSGLRTQPVTREDPVFHFQPNRTLTFSRDWNFKMLNYRRVNGTGWVNDQVYTNDDVKPLLAVIGDSYIEASMVPYAETMYGRLAKDLHSKLRVYSFGASGAPLSQYLIWARHAVRNYGAKALIINVVGNDFDESHVTYLNGPGWWVYAPAADGELQLRLAEYRPGLLRSLAYNSALARYIFFNLQFADSWRRVKNLIFGSPAVAAPAPMYAGNTLAAVDAERLNLSMKVIESVFRDLPSFVDLPPNRILFTVDGFRYPDSVPNVDTYFGIVRKAFIAKARSLNYGVIDLDEWFFRDYTSRHQRLEYPTDGHWSGVGHEVAARAVLASDLLRTLGVEH